MNVFSDKIQNQRFQHAVSVVLLHEGGFSDDKEDRGGDTNFGISLRYLRDIKIDVDGDGDIDGQDIRRLTRNKAISIYKKYWWDKYGYNNIKNIDVATKIFDMSVNMGSKQSHKIVQRSLNTLGFLILVDGKFGINTLSAVNRCDSKKLLNIMRHQCASFYFILIKKHPVLAKFKNGWLKRAAF